jgi:hypothetical protein
MTAAGTPFEPSLFLGTVSEVYPDRATANLPSAAAPSDARSRIKAVVGEFVFIECELTAVLGRIVETRVPPGQRLELDDQIGKTTNIVNPIGIIQLLATWDSSRKELVRGLIVIGPHRVVRVEC